MTNQSRRNALQRVQIHSSTNAGLWMARYLERQTRVPDVSDWEQDQAKIASTTLISEVSKTPRMASGYRSAFDRRLIALAGPDAGRYARLVVFRCVGRVVVGLGERGVLENGITLERTWGVPILPGPSLKGVTAAAAHKLTDDPAWRKETKTSELGESASWLFGTTEHAGLVTFHDAWWVPDQELPEHRQQLPLHADVITAHNPKYYQESGGRATEAPDGMTDPVPVSFLSASGHFLVVISSRPEDQAWADAALDLLTLGLRHLGVGAKTNAGYGKMEPAGDFTAKLQETIDRRASFEALVSQPFSDLLAEALDETLANKKNAEALCDALKRLHDQDEKAPERLEELFNSQRLADALATHPRSTSLEDAEVVGELRSVLAAHPTLKAWAAGEQGEVEINRRAGPLKRAAAWAGASAAAQEVAEPVQQADPLAAFPLATSLPDEAKVAFRALFGEDGAIDPDGLEALEEQVLEWGDAAVELWDQLLSMI